MRARFLLSTVLSIAAITTATPAASARADPAAAPSRSAPTAGATATAPIGEHLAGPGQYVPVAPFVAVPDTNLVASRPLVVQLSGTGGIPTGVSAVAVHVVTSGHRDYGSVEVAPDGTGVEPVSVVSFTRDRNASVMDVVTLPSTGKVSFRTTTAVALRVHVFGYFTSSGDQTPGSTFVALPAVPLADAVQVPAGGSTTVTVAGANGVAAAADVAAASVVITASGPAAAGSVQAYPADTAATTAHTSLYYAANENRSLTHVLPLSAEGKITLTSTAATTISVYLRGYFQKPTGRAAGSVYVPTSTSSLYTGAFRADETKNLTFSYVNWFAPADIAAIAAHWTVERPTGAGAVQTWPGGTPAADVSLLYNNAATQDDFDFPRISAKGALSIRTTAAAQVHLRARGVFVRAKKPEPPTAVTATPGDGEVSVVWRPPASNGGAVITRYTVLAKPGGKTVQVTAGEAAVVPGLTNGQQYTFVVTATNAVGASVPSAPSDPATPVAQAPPGAPFITDTYARDSAARVTWSPPETGATAVAKYVVTAQPGGATVEAPGTATQVIVAGLSNGTPYTFTVVAVNGAGPGEPSPSSDLTTPEPADVPLKPALSSMVAFNERVDVQWSPPADGGSPITGYTVTVQPGGRTVAVAPDTTVVALTGLTNETAYTVSITATNRAGVSAPLVAGPVTPRSQRAPAAPTDVRATVTYSGYVDVEWSAPADVGTSPVTGYTVRAEPGGVTLSSVTTKATFIGLSNTTNYTFTVAAANTAGAGPASAATMPLLPKFTAKKYPTLLDERDVASLRSVHPDGTLLFEHPSSSISWLKPGDLLVVPPDGKAERGLFRRITAVSQSGSLLAVSTEEAGIDESLTNGGLAFNSVLDTGDVASFVPMVPGVRLREPTVKGRTARQGAPGARAGAPNVGLRDGTLVVELQYDIGPTVDGAGGKAEMTFELEPKQSTDVDLSLSGIDTTFRMTARTKVETRFKAGVIKQFEKQWTIAKIKGRCFNVQAGPLPIVICMEFDVKVKFEVDGSVGVTLAASYEREFGAQMQTRNADVTFTKIDDGGTGKSELTLYGDLQAKLSLPVEFTLYFYGAAGPGIVARPYLQLKADTTQDPWWEVRAGAELGAFIKTKRFFGREIDWRNDHLLDVFMTLKHAGGPFIGMLVSPKEAEARVGQVVDLDVAVTRYPDNIPVQWKVVAGPGTIDGSGRYTAVRNGVATIEAVSPTDGVRPELVARGAVVVGGGPPDPPGTVTATAAPLSANVTWAKAGNDGGHPVTRYVLTTVPPTATTFVDGGTTSARIRGLSPGTSYTISVHALNERGSSTPAVSNSVAPLDRPVRIGVRTNIAVDELGNPDRFRMAGVGGAAVSGNGRYAFFLVQGRSNLAPPEIHSADSEVEYLVRQDLWTGEIILASRGLDGVTPVPASGGWYVQGGNRALPPGFTSNRDGTVVAFVADNITGPLYVHDIAARKTWNAGAGVPADSFSAAPALSDDGTVVAFTAWNGFGRIYRRTAGGPLVQVDNCMFGAACNDTEDVRRIGWFKMSAAGDRIVYDDVAVVNGVKQRHALLYDAVVDSTTDLTAEARPREESWRPVISGDGTTVAFNYADRNSTVLPRAGVILKKVAAGRAAVTDIVLPEAPGDQVTANELSRDGQTLAYSKGSDLQVGHVYEAASGTVAKIGRPPNDTSFLDRTFDLSDDGGLLVWTGSMPCDDDCGGGVWAQIFG